MTPNEPQPAPQQNYALDWIPLTSFIILIAILAFVVMKRRRARQQKSYRNFVYAPHHSSKTLISAPKSAYSKRVVPLRSISPPVVSVGCPKITKTSSVYGVVPQSTMMRLKLMNSNIALLAGSLVEREMELQGVRAL